MIEIGGKPILWHIMKMYAHHGIQEFIICCGYKGYVIKEYFANYLLHGSDVTFDMKSNSMHVHEMRAEPWTVTLVDTGDDSMTADVSGASLGMWRAKSPFASLTEMVSVISTSVRRSPSIESTARPPR